MQTHQGQLATTRDHAEYLIVLKVLFVSKHQKFKNVLSLTVGVDILALHSRLWVHNLHAGVRVRA